MCRESCKKTFLSHNGLSGVNDKADFFCCALNLGKLQRWLVLSAGVGRSFGSGHFGSCGHTRTDTKNQHDRGAETHCDILKKFEEHAVENHERDYGVSGLMRKVTAVLNGEKVTAGAMAE
jgi:hypothetical protein